MKATKNGLNKGINQAHKNDKNFTCQYTLIDLKTGDTIIKLKIYQTDLKTCVCVWVYDKKDTFMGSDFASGYGYDLQSNAALSAFKNAGFDITEGHKDPEIEAMMHAVAELLGYTKVKAYVASA